MSDSKLEEQVSVIDSEASVDYYVTTVNDKSTKNSVSDISDKVIEQPVSIVVSVDRSGSVKVRKRKKSKRRKKKSNLALEEPVVRASDDGAIFLSSGSDGSQSKVPKRSSSLCESDLRKNSKVFFVESLANGIADTKDPASQSQNEPSVRRRPKKKSSFKNNRRGMIMDYDNTDINKMVSSDQSRVLQNYKKRQAHSCKETVPQAQPQGEFNGVKNQHPAKKVNQQDALATLDAFMMEVREATTVAKRWEGARRKDPMLRRSHSMNEILADDADLNGFSPEEVNEIIPPPVHVSSTQAIPKSVPWAHKKSESIGQNSVLSGSVFLSDQDVSIEEGKHSFSHSSLTKTSSGENRSERRSKSLYDLVMATDAAVLTEMMCKKVSQDQLEKTRSQSRTSQRKGKDFDYGIAHLEQVCKLIEQIGDLRHQNEALMKRVHELEAEVKSFKKDEGYTVVDSNNPDAFYTLSHSKRSHPVGRIKDVISRSRKSSVDKHHPSHDHKGISQPLMLMDENPPFGSSLPTSAFAGIPPDRPVIYSSINLKKNKRRPLYSRDDLDLSLKGRWKFWKPPPRHGDKPMRKQVVSSIKAEHTQGSAIHLKSASVTLDSLLNNIDNNFSQKMLQWQAAPKTSRAPSRASEVSSEMFNRTIQSNSSSGLPQSSDESMKFRVNRIDDKPDGIHKESFRQKLGRWEKVAARKLSLDRRSKSVDRMNMANDIENDSNMLRYRSTSAGADFHKSMPCVMSASTDGRLRNIKRMSVNPSLGSVEWSGLQEAFPTSQANGKPIRRMVTTSHSRLTSPLRKKNSNKRRSWSFAKRVSSKYYLPSSGDFAIGSNLELAGSIGDQLTLQLDQEDVKGITTGVNDEELDYLKKNTADLREKLNVIEREWGKEPSKQQIRQRPASSLATYRADPNALSFRRSNRVGTLHLSSCDVLTSSAMMSPLLEESESPLLCHSLPDLCKSAECQSFVFSDVTEHARRHTLSEADFRRRSSKLSAISSSAPSCLDRQDVADAREPPHQRSISDAEATEKPVKRRWVTTNLLNSRIFNSRSSSSDSLSQKPPYKGDAAKKTPKKRRTIAGKMYNRLHKMSPKSRRSTSPSKSVSSFESESSASASSKKKIFRMLSMRSKKVTSPVKIVYSVDDELAKPGDDVTNAHDDVTIEEHKPRSKSESLLLPKSKPSTKIAEISERLTEEGSSSRRNSASPPKIAKGIVGRLSKRFAGRSKRAEQEDGEGKKIVRSGSTQSRSAIFLSAKSVFEERSDGEQHSSLNKNNNNCCLLLSRSI